MFKSTLFEETHPFSVDFRCKGTKNISHMQINVRLFDKIGRNR